MASFTEKYRDYRHCCLYVNGLMEIFFSLGAKIEILFRFKNRSAKNLLIFFKNLLLKNI